ncbi:MAG TPA: lactate racemase domain-containing protein [Chloroflexota bacterium]
MAVVLSSEKTFRLPWGDSQKELRIPADRITAEIEFTDLPPIEDPAAALRQAMDAPIGKPPLRELVKPGDRVALLTGDRITDRMLGSRDGLGQVILDYLNAAGVRDQDVTFVFAPGTHAHRNVDEKIGARLIDRVGRYVKHRADIDEELTFRGYTSRGNALWINRHVAEADVVIGFGEICPNTHGGWTGGGKIILPGVAGQATVEHNHRNLMLPETPLGLADGNPLRLDMEEAADLGGLDFKIDVLVDSRERMVDVYAGDFRKEHRAALPKARQIWTTPMERTDVHVFYPGDTRERTLESAMFISISAADLATKPDGVIIACLSAVDGYSQGEGLPYNERQRGRDVLKMSAEQIARDMILGRGNTRTGSIHFATRHCLDRKRVYLVCDGIEATEAREFGFAACFRDFQTALAQALEEKGASASISVSFPRGIAWRQMPYREG